MHAQVTNAYHDSEPMVNGDEVSNQFPYEGVIDRETNRLIPIGFGVSVHDHDISKPLGKPIAM
jgi:hypothetical protein